MKTLTLILIIAAIIITAIAVIAGILNRPIGPVTPNGILDFAQIVLLFAIAVAVYDRIYGGD
jgi:EamA domain-containing membrane protein RarD